MFCKFSSGNLPFKLSWPVRVFFLFKKKKYRVIKLLVITQYWGLYVTYSWTPIFCSLHSNSPLDVQVKGEMIKDLMNLAGFQLPDKKDVYPNLATATQK